MRTSIVKIACIALAMTFLMVFTIGCACQNNPVVVPPDNTQPGTQDGGADESPDIIEATESPDPVGPETTPSDTDREDGETLPSSTPTTRPPSTATPSDPPETSSTQAPETTPKPTEAPAPTNNPKPTPTNNPKPTPTNNPKPTPTHNPTPIPTPVPTPVPTPTPDPSVPKPLPNFSITNFERELHRLINEYRVANEACELELVQHICQLAYVRAEESLEFWSHTRPDGTGYYTVFEEYGVTGYGGVGENLARGYESAEEVFNAWINSPGHRDTLMTPYLRFVGYAVYRTSGGGTFICMLITRNRGSVTAPGNSIIHIPCAK